MLLVNGNINSRNNNLNFIRLIAAISVTFGHSFAMQNGSHYNILFNINSGGFGFYAVAIFFGLSGFLITQSFDRKPQWKVFLKARVLRLLPGYLFANLITALIIVFLIKNEFSLVFSTNFFLHILGGSFKESSTFPNVFSHLHYNSSNGSLWTLPREFQMYIVVLICGLTKVFKKKELFLVLFCALFLIAFMQIDSVFNLIFPFFLKIKTYEGTFLSLPFSFGLGVLAYLYKDKIPLIMSLAVVLLLGSFFTEGWFWKNLAWIYFVFCFGYMPNFYLAKLNFKNDISYGIYILSWPIQQTLLHFKATDHPVVLFIFSMCIVIPLSIFSWKVVEEPCLRLKG